VECDLLSKLDASHSFELETPVKVPVFLGFAASVGPYGKNCLCLVASACRVVLHTFY